MRWLLWLLLFFDWLWVNMYNVPMYQLSLLFTFWCNTYLMWLFVSLNCSVRTPISMKFFPRFFLLYFLVFHIYFFSYAYGMILYCSEYVLLCWNLFVLSEVYVSNFSRFFIFGSLYCCSIYAAPYSVLLESFWGNDHWTGWQFPFLYYDLDIIF